LKIVFHLFKLSSFHIAKIINQAQIIITNKAILHNAIINFCIKVVKNHSIVRFQLDQFLKFSHVAGEKAEVSISNSAEHKESFHHSQEEDEDPQFEEEELEF